ncbi:MAG: inorganic phosphate transporter [Bauldia sp.]|nr:inorganic phosphate transporter [Bauldia sp.]
MSALAHLDKHLKKVGHLEEASSSVARPFAAPGLAVSFLIVIFVFAIATTATGPLSLYVVAAAVISGYMALYVGANDVANNVGPAVGGRAMTLATALAIAAVFEAAGALIAGGDVVATISKDIIRPHEGMDAVDFILLMMAGFLASAMWIHLATYLGAPVSTTHSVVGGVLGAGIAASGTDVVSWPTMGAIAASWVVSPVLGGLLAAGLYWVVRSLIVDRPEPFAAARRWLPAIVAAMAGVFAVYLTTKGLSHVWKPTGLTALAIGLVAFVVVAAVSMPWIKRQSAMIERTGRPVTALFSFPLIAAAALLCFAHGANDVANAIGPLAAIVAAAEFGVAAPQQVALPFWVLFIGAAGISLGLALFGPTVIRTVGEKITKMNPSRAYCVALSAATTVLIASALGLPVSSTHITVGGVFGIGLLREAITNRGIPNPGVQPRMRSLRISELNETPEQAVSRTKQRERRKLVRRQYALSIGAAWVITVPATAALAVALYAILSAAAGV